MTGSGVSWVVLAGQRAPQRAGGLHCDDCGSAVVDVRAVGWGRADGTPVLCGTCAVLELLRSRTRCAWRDADLYATAVRLNLWLDVEPLDLDRLRRGPHPATPYQRN